MGTGLPIRSARVPITDRRRCEMYDDDPSHAITNQQTKHGVTVDIDGVGLARCMCSHIPTSSGGKHVMQPSDGPRTCPSFDEPDLPVYIYIHVGCRLGIGFRGVTRGSNSGGGSPGNRGRVTDGDDRIGLSRVGLLQWWVSEWV